jgi:hypothetical protein
MTSPYREVFRPEAGKADPGRVFYTITTEDVGNRFIQTTAGVIELGSIIGYVLKQDVGKRLIRVPRDDPRGAGWTWQCESDAQRDARLARS